MTVQEMLDIAGRYYTAMADAMIDACVEWATRTNTPLRESRRSAPSRRAEKRPDDDMDHHEWRRLMEGNSDTRHQHV